MSFNFPFPFSWDCKLFGHRAGDKECLVDKTVDKTKKKSSVKFSDEPVFVDSKVIDMLKNYEPSAKERKPFWCRICRFQGDSLESFNTHLESDSHLLTAEAERKLSRCKLCRKQFTSPDQLKEHVKGKAHKQTLLQYQRNNRK